MRFPPSFLEEVKARLKVSDVVRTRVKLVRAGREWRGLSPFTSEKTPSFFVNDQKMAWFDFSAGRSGNIFDFVMATEGLGFAEAVERLAGMAGLALPKPSREAEAREKARVSLHDAVEGAACYFSAMLDGRAGARARAYLEARGLSRDLQVRFRLGYAPGEKFALRDHLAAKGVPVETMIEAGLLVHGEGIAVPYDRFRDRIMFPICDPVGKVIAFGGRALAKDVPAKYLNSPETILFHKGSVLYNHHNARKAAHDSGRVVVVEGYIDVVAMTGSGFPDVVAPMGTALTEEHCALLWRMAEAPVLCFDGDRAGRMAAYRAIDTALPLIGPGRSFSFALLPEGMDPDDLLRQADGRGMMEDCLARAHPLADLIFRRETEAGTLSTPEQKAALERRLLDVARAISDTTLRRYYEAEFRARLDALLGRPAGSSGARRDRRFGVAGPRRAWREPAAHGVGSAGRGAGPLPISPSLANSPLLARSPASLPPREGLILLLLLNHPGLLERYAEDIADAEFSNREADALRGLFLRLAGTGEEGLPDPRAAAEAAGLGGVVKKLDLLALHASHWYARPEAAEADAEEVLKQALTLHRRARKLHKELQLAELALGKDSSEANLGRLNDIREQLTALGGTEASIEGFGVLSGRRGRAS